MEQRRSVVGSVLLTMPMLMLMVTGCAVKPEIPAVPLPGAIVAEAPQLNAGDTWTWFGDGTDDRTRTETFERYDGEAMVLHVTTNTHDRTRIRTKDGNLMHDLNASGESVKMRKPHSGFLSFPLFVGKTWKHTYVNSGTSRDSRYKVVAYQPVTTPAGTFDAFKIEGLDQRWDRPYGIIVTLWYAPAVKNIVKFAGEEGGNHNPVSGWNFELQQYALRE